MERNTGSLLEGCYKSSPTSTGEYLFKKSSRPVTLDAVGRCLSSLLPPAFLWSQIIWVIRITGKHNSSLIFERGNLIENWYGVTQFPSIPPVIFQKTGMVSPRSISSLLIPDIPDSSRFYSLSIICPRSIIMNREGSTSCSRIAFLRSRMGYPGGLSPR